MKERGCGCEETEKDLLPTMTIARAAASGLSRRTGRNSATPFNTPYIFVSNNYPAVISIYSSTPLLTHTYLLERLHVLPRRLLTNPRIQHKQIDAAAIRRIDLLLDAAPRIAVADVHVHGFNRRGKGARNLGEECAVDVGKEQFEAVGGAETRDCQADARGGTGNERDIGGGENCVWHFVVVEVVVRECGGEKRSGGERGEGYIGGVIPASSGICEGRVRADDLLWK